MSETASSLLLDQSEMERAFFAKDKSYDGLFFVAVRTTGIFCLPSCPASPNRENVEFFRTVREAVLAGYRPCKRCQPTQVHGTPPLWVTRLLNAMDARPDRRITAAELRRAGITPERARRWFLDHYGMTFVEWQRGRRLAEAFTQIRNGSSLDDVIFDSGYESHSGFRDAFVQTFRATPGARSVSDAEYIAIQFIPSPLGQLVAAALPRGVCFLEFSDRRMLERIYGRLRARFRAPILPTSNDALEQLRAELTCYFRGAQKTFGVPLVVSGTTFQERVWSELAQIPFGETISYKTLAMRIGRPSAVRAVARANATNPLSILIPCHRVVGTDGKLTGYGGGLWRKRLLLDLERTGRLPGVESILSA